MDREIGKQGERNEGNATRPAEFDFVDLMRESLLNQPVKDSATNWMGRKFIAMSGTRMVCV
jgi:hypothetical protein